MSQFTDLYWFELHYLRWLFNFICSEEFKKSKYLQRVLFSDEMTFSNKFIEYGTILESNLTRAYIENISMG